MHSLPTFFRAIRSRDSRRAYHAAAICMATLIFAVGLSLRPAHAAASEVCDAETLHSGDQLWSISTRDLDCAEYAGSSNPRFIFNRFDPATGWQQKSQQEFLDTNPADLPTCFYIHGNRLDFSWAQRRVWDAYRGIRETQPSSVALRVVIWSWPSDRVRGPLRDVRTKAARTDSEGYYLASMLSAIDANSKVSLIGHSFGARIATGALHVLGGGTLAGRRLSSPTPDSSPRILAVLLAAGLDDDWLLEGGCHDRALSQVDQMLVLTNSCDPVLRRFGFISNASAVGLSGLLLPDQPSGLAQRVQHWDVTHLMGKTHAPANYLAEPTIMAVVARYALWHGLDK